jgi:hypothetical protein
MTYATFHVRGDVEAGFRDRFLKGIQRDAFKQLEVESEAEESVGWVAIEHPFDTELDHDSVFYNSYLNLGLRIDRWRIPAPLFRAYFTEAERKYLAETGRERLSKRDKEELKAVVTLRMKRQSIPTMKVIDLSWNLDTGVVRFWNQSAKTQEVLEELFESTFGLHLVRDTPYVVAMHTGLDEARLDALLDLEPTQVHTRDLLGAELDDAGGE